MKRFLTTSLPIGRFLLLLLPALGCGNLYAKLQGQAAIDSMLKVLPKAKEDTNTVKLLNGL